MGSKISKPNFPEKIGEIDLDSNLRQELSIPMEFESKDYKIYCKYSYEKGEKTNKRELNINVPDIPTPTTVGSGLWAQFEQDDFLNYHNDWVKGHNDYYHNEKVAKFFAKNIQPILEEKLPEYMKELINLDK